MDMKAAIGCNRQGGPSPAEQAERNVAVDVVSGLLPPTLSSNVSCHHLAHSAQRHTLGPKTHTNIATHNTGTPSGRTQRRHTM